MEPMTHIQRVEVADLLHHADHGFAWVEERTDEGLRLAWSRSDVPTSTLFPASRLDELQLCVPGGFMDKAQRCPDEARDLVQDRPLHAVERLLDDLGGAASPEELTDWLGALGLLPAAQASAWRERVLARVKRGSAGTSSGGRTSAWSKSTTEPSRPPSASWVRHRACAGTGGFAVTPKSGCGSLPRWQPRGMRRPCAWSSVGTTQSPSPPRPSSFSRCWHGTSPSPAPCSAAPMPGPPPPSPEWPACGPSAASSATCCSPFPPPSAPSR